MIPGPNWTRRYRSPSRRLCARAGCGAQAAATLRFQPTRREAWLVDLDGDVARTEGDLCSRHASALVLPRGWALHDQRQTTVEETESDPPVHPPRPRRVHRVRVPPPEPVPEPAVLEISLVEDAEAASDDLAAMLDARTPLLRRAFGNIQLD